MARVAKSLAKGAHGHPHRDHRSKKGRSKGAKYRRHLRVIVSKRMARAVRLDREMDRLQEIRDNWLDEL